jgi:Tfp pilus assembly protein PilX
MTPNKLASVIADNRGNVLITALMLIFACSIMGATVVLLSSTDLKISGNEERDTQALFVAEAGLAEAVHRLSLPNPTMESGMNVAIGDDKPYDPNWKVYLQLNGSAPSESGSTWYVPTLQDLSGDYLPYSEPSGTGDEVLQVEHKWEDRDGDGVRDDDEIVRYDPTLVPPENFDTGFPVDVVTVTGRDGDARRTLQAEVTRQTLNVKAMGAFYTDKAVEIKGTSAFCGWNHPLSTPAGSRPNVCFPYHLPDGNLGGITTTGDAVVEKGASHDIEGDPPTDTDPANPWYTLAELLGITQSQLNDLLADPDYTAPADVMEGITYIQGDATFNAGMRGNGLIYVTGDVAINGGFEYYGLIYIEGDGNITGTPWILGSVCIRGTADWNFSAGNCGILYSAESIEQYVGQAMPMQILAWRDL